jgi:hypothetical protein
MGLVAYRSPASRACTPSAGSACWRSATVARTSVRRAVRLLAAPPPIFPETSPSSICWQPCRTRSLPGHAQQLTRPLHPSVKAAAVVITPRTTVLRARLVYATPARMFTATCPCVAATCFKISLRPAACPSCQARTFRNSAPNTETCFATCVRAIT